MITKNLERMKEISDELLAFSTRVAKVVGASYEFNGNCLDVLYDDGMIEIVKGHFGAGATIDRHTHQQTEHYLVIAGQIDLIIGDDRITLCKNDYYNIPSSVVHAMEAIKESVCLFIRVPSSGATTHG